MTTPRTKIIYHDPCLDGFAAAWAAHEAFGDEADYVPARYGSEPPDVLGCEVYILDFSYPRTTLLQMADDARSLRVLDHHKSAQEELEGLDFALFDMERSGAGLAWDELVGGPRSWLVNYVEDRDLWRFSLPGSKEVNAYLATVEQTFAAWSSLRERPWQWAQRLGADALAYVDRYVRDMVKHASLAKFAEFVVPVVNAPPAHISELLNDLAVGQPFALGWFQRGDGRYQYSVRSVGDFDVSMLARRFGGGGHRNAAGFVLDHAPSVEDRSKPKPLAKVTV